MSRSQEFAHEIAEIGRHIAVAEKAGRRIARLDRAYCRAEDAGQVATVATVHTKIKAAEAEARTHRAAAAAIGAEIGLCRCLARWPAPSLGMCETCRCA